MTTTTAPPRPAPPRDGGPGFGLLDMLRFSRDPIAFWQDVAARFPDPCWLKVPNGTRALVTWHEDGVRDVFMAPPASLGVYGAELMEPLLGKGSLLALEGEPHKKRRKLLAPPFHGERMAAYGSIVVDTTRRALERAPRGVPTDVRHLTEEISFEVILRAGFGIHDEAELARTRRIVTAAVDAATPLVVFVNAARKDLGRFSPGGRLARARGACDELLREMIAARRARRAAASSTTSPAQDDILSLLLDVRDDEGAPLSDDELKDELKTMIVAGHETTATALAWAVYELGKDAAVRARAVDEVRALGTPRAPDAVAKLPYLGAVLSESMRLRPIVADLLRAVKAPITVRGVDVAPGDALCVAIPLTHRLPELYPDPDTFKPERFLDARPSPFAYAPFGGGMRRCIGSDFAMFEAKIVLAALLVDASFELVDKAFPGTRLRNITVGPRRPIHVLWK